jgi:hypothetical protein
MWLRESQPAILKLAGDRQRAYAVEISSGKSKDSMDAWTKLTNDAH